MPDKGVEFLLIETERAEKYPLASKLLMADFKL